MSGPVLTLVKKDLWLKRRSPIGSLAKFLMPMVLVGFVSKQLFNASSSIGESMKPPRSDQGPQFTVEKVEPNSIRVFSTQPGHCVAVKQMAGQNHKCSDGSKSGPQLEWTHLEFTSQTEAKATSFDISKVWATFQIVVGDKSASVEVFHTEVERGAIITILKRMQVTLVGFLLAVGWNPLVGSILDERRNGLTELLRIHGVRTWQLHLSDIINYGSQLLIQSLVSAFFLQWYLLTEVPFLAIAGILMLFALNIAGLSLMLKTAIKNNIVGNIVYNVVVIVLAQVAGFADIDEPVTRDLLMMLLPHRAFMHALLPLSLSPDVGSRVLVAMLMLLVNVILYNGVYMYLEAVMPRNFGIPKPWYFPVRWCFRRPQVTKSGETHDDTVREEISLREEQLIREGRVVKVTQLSKVFGSGSSAVQAVDEVSLTLYPSEVLCLLGANAAGKSTLTALLLGVLEATSGSGEMFALDLKRDLQRIRAVTGFCPQEDILWPSLTVSEHLQIFAGLRGQRAQGTTALAKLLEDSGFARHQGAQVQNLSGGMKRKLNALIAFSSNNKFVVLDEPTTGLDPVSRRALWEMISKLKAGRVVCVTTHFIEEAALLSDRVAIMDHGKLKAVGSPTFLKKAFGCESTVSLDQTTGKVQVTGGKLEDVFIQVAGGEKQVAVEAVEQGYPTFFTSLTAAFSMRLYLGFRRPLLLVGIMAISLLAALGAANVRHMQMSHQQLSETLGAVPLWLVQDPNVAACQAFPTPQEVVKTLQWKSPPAGDLGTKWQELVDEHKDQRQFAAVTVVECGDPPKLSILIKAEKPESVGYFMLNKLFSTLLGKSFESVRLVEHKDPEWIEVYELLLVFLTVMAFSMHIGLFINWTHVTKKFLFHTGMGPVSYWLGNLLFDVCLCLTQFCIWFAVLDLQGLQFSPGILALAFACMLSIVTTNYLCSLVLSNPIGLSAVAYGAHVLLSTVLFMVYLGKVEKARWNERQSDMKPVETPWLVPAPGALLARGLTAHFFPQIVSSANLAGTLWSLGWAGVCFFFVLLADVFRYRVVRLSSRARSKPKGDVESGNLPVLQYNGATKTFGSRHAVHDVNLDLNCGEGLTMLGPNSAGKTTLTRLGIGEVTPTTGHVTVEEARVGICSQADVLISDLTVEDHLRIFGLAKGVKNLTASIESISRMLGIREFWSRDATKLSGGNKRKLSLSLALLGGNRLLFLDEPSSGMDPLSQRFMWRLLQGLTKSGASVLLTTHSMEEAEAVSSRIAIMLHGSIRCQGTLQELKHAYGQGYEITLAVAAPAGELFGEILSECQVALGDSNAEFLDVLWAKQFVYDRHAPAADAVLLSLPDSGLISVQDLTLRIAETETLLALVKEVPRLKLIDSSRCKAKLFLADEDVVTEVLENLRILKAAARINDFSLRPLSLEEIFNKIASSTSNLY